MNTRTVKIPEGPHCITKDQKHMCRFLSYHMVLSRNICGLYAMDLEIGEHPNFINKCDDCVKEDK